MTEPRPKERTFIALLLGMFLGRYGLPFMQHVVYIVIIIVAVFGKSVIKMESHPVQVQLKDSASYQGMYDSCLNAVQAQIKADKQK